MLKLRIIALAATAALALTGLTGVADAAAKPAKTKVTIQVDNGYDFHGTVKSRKLRRCAKDREITLFKQLGPTQDPTVDAVIAYDTSELQGKRGVWSTGNTGGGAGKFYARAAKKPGCKAGSSRTVEVEL